MVREKHTSNLYWFTLIPRATSSPQKPLGIYYAIKIHITNTPPKKWPWTPQVTHFLWHTNTTEIRTPSDFTLTHQYSEIQEIQKVLHLMKIKSKDYSNHIPLLWENPKAWMQILKTQICFHTFTNVSKLLSNFKFVKTFKAWSYSVRKHLKLICKHNRNFVMDFQQTIGWILENTDWIGLIAKSTKSNRLKPFSKTSKCQTTDWNDKTIGFFPLIYKTIFSKRFWF